MKHHTAYIALGSNLGNREQNLRSAVAMLGPVKISSFLDNPAMGGPADSPPFLNAAAEMKTDLEAPALLDQLLEIERGLGRHRREKWGPRTIDLDLLLYDDQIIQLENLVIPHPLMHERKFVLQPMVEIAPQVVHPVLKKTMQQLLKRL